MKKIALLALMGFCCTNFTMAQLRVASGQTNTYNMTVGGIAGMNKTGALTVYSNTADPSYNPISPNPLALICTKTDRTEGINPFLAYTNNSLIYYVDYRGYVYSKGNITLSDSLCKTDVTELYSPLHKLKSLHGVSFNYKQDSEEKMSRTMTLNDEENVTLSLGATPEISEQIAEEQNRKRIGLIAQEVEQVFPEVVRTQFDGTKGVLYSDLIGVLVEAINELQDSMAVQATQIAIMQQQLNAVQAIQFANNSGTSPAQPRIGQGNVASTGLGQSEAILYQNNPNPFNRQTTIAYRLPYDITNAAICIYNLNGQQLKKYSLDETVIAGDITVAASEFTPGMYIYALIIDGQMVSSKRMVLTD